MSAAIPYHSRLNPSMNPGVRPASAKATRAQSALEYILFAAFGAMILIAAVALVITNSPRFNSVPNRLADGIKSDRVNLLILETSRGRRYNEVRTDAILLLSMKPSTKETVVTSIPRDLWVKLGKSGTRRLGAVSSVGNSSGYPGAAPGLASDTVAGIIQQPVHAYLTLDEPELANAIDGVGGIDINVRRGVFDAKSNDRFRRGKNHLDGTRAVRYANSPDVAGPAAQRTARESRQQQVIAAFVVKASFEAAAGRTAALQRLTQTNLTPQQIGWLTVNAGAREPRRLTLAPYLDTFQVTTLADNGEAVRPRSGDFSQIQQVVADVFTPTAITAR